MSKILPCQHGSIKCIFIFFAGGHFMLLAQLSWHQQAVMLTSAGPYCYSLLFLFPMSQCLLPGEIFHSSSLFTSYPNSQCLGIMVLWGKMFLVTALEEQFPKEGDGAAEFYWTEHLPGSWPHKPCCSKASWRKSWKVLRLLGVP